jgi:mannose-6-phosphate isomerase-like protein (cupin superfamily)
MKRHPALIALSHDHHHALVEARRLRHAAASDEDPAAAASAFRRFYAGVTVLHFREEEERLFPLVVDAEARPLLVRALLDHQRLHALSAALDDQGDLRTSMRELGQRLEAHVRLEERELFPLIERLAPAELDSLDGAEVPGGGPVWGAASEDLNATLLAWSVGGGPPEHVNDERDVLIFVTEGSATVMVDGEERRLAAGEGLIVDKGRRRKITAGSAGVHYLSVHLRRPPLEILPANRRSEA